MFEIEDTSARSPEYWPWPAGAQARRPMERTSRSRAGLTRERGHRYSPGGGIPMMRFLAVGAGGFLGAIARYAVGLLVARFWSGEFPLATFLINVSGSFVL